MQTAVKFLQNPQVVNTSLAKKQRFLQRKGLTDNEVQEACERAGAYILHENENKIIQSSQLNIPMPINSSAQLVKYGLLERIKDIVQNMALFSAVVYAIYIFYQVEQ